MTLLKLWLVSAQTVSAYGSSPHDDQLFLSQAVSIVRGEWLGAFSEATLAKGPVYPLWLALVRVTGVRFLLAQAVVYAVACAVLASAVRPIAPDAWRRALLYLLLLFNPVSWADGPATRTLREGIYSSLSILLLGLAIGAALRLRRAPSSAAIWGAAAGLAGGLFAMTREEGPWVIPSLAIIVTVGMAAARPLAWRKVLTALGAAWLGYAAPIAAVSAINAKHYGVFETCETSSHAFTAAYGALTRVKTASWHPLVPVPRDARRRLYEASPAFREIEPFLEGSVAGWARFGCGAVGVCDDIAGGWFQWALRGAAAKAGKYRTGAVARDWYERVAHEVDDACRSARLDCLPARSTLMPPWNAAYLPPLLSAVGRAAVYAGTFAGVTPHPSPSRAVSELDLAWFERITNERIPRPRILMRGMVESRAGEVHAAVLDASGNPAPASIEQSPATLPAADAGSWASRLDVETSCILDCNLVLLADGRALVVPLSSDSPPRGEAALAWTTQDRRYVAVPAEDQPGRDRRLAVLATITSAYQVALPPLLALAIALLLWRIAQAARARTLPVASVLALSLLVAVVVRLLLLALVEVTSFPGVNVGYLSPAHPLLLAFVALVLMSGEERAARHRPSDEPASPPPTATG